MAALFVYIFSSQMGGHFSDETVKPQETVSSQKSPQQNFENEIHARVDDLMKDLKYTKYTQTGEPDLCNATNVVYNSDKTFSMALVLLIPCYRIPPQLLKVENLDNPGDQTH
jgi:hypothetical protein